MACYAALASLLELLDNILHNAQYPKFLRGKRRWQVMESLHGKFNSLQELLQDYSSKGDEAADSLAMRVTSAAYQTQDILELEISSQIDRNGEQNVFRKISHKLNFFRRRSLSLLEMDVDENLHKMELEVDSLLRAMMDIKESQTNENFHAANYSIDARASKPATSDKVTMVGFNDHLIAIKDQLCGYPKQLRVIPIVGMGGVGKTTLSRNIFDDALIVDHFDCRAWGTVSQNCNVNRVLEGILQSLGLTKDGLKHGDEESDLKLRIYRHLKGRTYLVVLDDIWKTSDWDNVRQIFPDACNGSRVVLTTRLFDVVDYVDKYSFTHKIECLDAEESWNLFLDKVFAGKQCPPELAGYGQSIVNACGGLPLAIVVIAGILSNDNTLQHWMSIARSTSSVLVQGDGDISKILSLSYNHLSHQLKYCFLYVGGFPEDHEINIFELIRLWIAEGFLKCSDQSKSLEKVGEELVEDLVRKSLIIITKRRANGQFKLCKMHDLLRDFCRDKATSENFFHIDGVCETRGVVNVHRLFLSDVRLESIQKIDGLVRSFHSFRFYDSHHHFESVLFKLERGNFRLLKILNAPRVRFMPFPIGTLQMFHLKYMAFHVRGILEILPSEVHSPISRSIYRLQNLQTIVLEGISEIKLPSSFWMMQQLRHVIIHYCMILPSPSGTLLRELQHLQTLDTVKGFHLTNENIAMIPNIKRLKLTYFTDQTLRHITNVYCLNNLARLTQLEELNIRCPRYYVTYSSGFRFPQSLIKLTLTGCDLPWEHETIGVAGSLPNLQVLRLRMRSFHGEEWKTKDGQFMRLKFLLLQDLELKYWRAETTHFPCLEQIKIRNCMNLEEIPLEIGDIPTLTFIEVFGSACAGESAKLIQQDQQDQGNDSLQVIVHNRKYGEWAA